MPSVVLCEQISPGNVTSEEQDGKIGTGDLGVPPQPLQGGSDSGDREGEAETGNEGAGT